MSTVKEELTRLIERQPDDSSPIRSMTIGLLLCAVAAGCAYGQSNDDGGPVARRLLADSAAQWRTVSVPGARLHLAPGGAADRDAAAVAESVTAIRRDLLALLSMPAAQETSRRADLFFLNSRDEMRQLTGRPLAGFIQEGEPTGVFVVTPGYRYASLLRHELAHLYSFEVWGAPRAGRWLVEGFAAWAAGSCQGHSPDELAAGAVARGALVPLTELANHFERVAEDVAMPEAASIVGFLVRREGLDTIRRRWKEEPGTVHPLGQTGPALEEAWLDELSRVRPATLDIPRLLVEGC
jgi:hypothetical protein